MKYFENHFFVLLSHIVTLAGISWIYSSLAALISVAITLIFLLTFKLIRKMTVLNKLGQLIVFSLIPFSYTTNDLIGKMNISWMSILPLALAIICLVIAAKIPKSRQESYLNVKSRYVDDKGIRKKANNFASRTLYFLVLPLTLAIFFFDWLPKLIISLAPILIALVLVYIYTAAIGAKKEKLAKEHIDY